VLCRGGDYIRLSRLCSWCSRNAFD